MTTPPLPPPPPKFTEVLKCLAIILSIKSWDFFVSLFTIDFAQRVLVSQRVCGLSLLTKSENIYRLTKLERLIQYTIYNIQCCLRLAEWAELP